jgi:DNA-binding NtrC family response regulator
VTVRIISATNADLPALIRAGQFREDLYYRLNVIEIQVPPLGDRPRDILPLAESFLPPGKRLSAEAGAALLRHRWPGNVRELRNVMQRAALLASSEAITAAELGLEAEAASPPPVEIELDRETIEEALARAGGVVSQAAAELGLSRQALYRRMERLGIGRRAPG